MKKISLRLLFVLFLSLSYGACNYISGNLGTKTNPLIIEILTPSAISEAVKHIDTIARFIEKDSGLKTAIYAPSKSIEYIQALSSSKRKADVAILNDIGYLFANDEFGARAELITTRGGSGVEALTSYCPAIVSVKLVSLEALNNHSIAFSDEYSTAGYLIPSFTLRENGIKVSKRVFAGSYQEALRMLISGKVDAAAIYTSCNSMSNELDGRSLVLKEFPDIFSRTTIIYKAPPIPNEPVVFRKNLPDNIREKVISSLMKCPLDSECRNALMSINSVTGFRKINGAEYNGLRKIIKSMEKETADLIPGGWILRIKNTTELPRTGN